MNALPARQSVVAFAIAGRDDLTRDDRTSETMRVALDHTRRAVGKGLAVVIPGASPELVRCKQDVSRHDVLTITGEVGAADRRHRELEPRLIRQPAVLGRIERAFEPIE